MKKSHRNYNFYVFILLILLEFNDKLYSYVWVDYSTYLMWEIKTEENIMKEYTWKEAISYCNDLNLNGFSDWWLPSTTQLKSISNISLFGEYRDGWEDWYMTHEKYKNNGFFIKRELSYNMGLEGDYWTISDKMSTSKAEEDFSWFVDFDAGYDDWTYMTSFHYVRCVRSAY